MNETLEIPTMFKRGGKENEWMLIPELAEGCEWTKDQPNILLGIKFDGVVCKVVVDGVKWTRDLYRKLGEAYFHVDINDPHPADRSIVEAYKNASLGTTLPQGFYIAMGPDIQGNNQNLLERTMVRIDPIDAVALVLWGLVKIKRGIDVSVQEFYDSIKAELEESTVQGVVFYWESPAMVTKKMAKVTRRDMGFDWPIKDLVTPSQLLKGVEPYIDADGTVYEVVG